MNDPFNRPKFQWRGVVNYWSFPEVDLDRSPQPVELSLHKLTAFYYATEKILSEVELLAALVEKK